jgi:hypothetical protein
MHNAHKGAMHNAHKGAMHNAHKGLCYEFVLRAKTRRAASTTSSTARP